MPEPKFAPAHLFAFSIESGHYSNGQAKCAFDKNIDDGTQACKDVYGTITPGTNLTNILNRESGNFSTSYTELIVNYRIVTALDENYKPLAGLSVKAGWNRYHNNLLLLLVIPVILTPNSGHIDPLGLWFQRAGG